jgi:hypothetical protein
MPRIARHRLLELMLIRMGRQEIAIRLRVPVGILNDWLSGDAIMPDAKVIALIHLVDETNSAHTH